MAPPALTPDRVPLPGILVLVGLLAWLDHEPDGWLPPLHALQESPAVPRDSAELRGEAEREQRRFERFHRRHLPLTREDWRGGGCDERVGRMCLRFDGVLDWEPTPEDSLVTLAREELLERLKEIGAKIPGDRWVLAQRIRYLGDVARWPEARALARSCSVSRPGWCQALRGYVFHRSGQGEAAQDAFEEALGAMDPGEAGRWWDPRLLLNYPEARWLDDARSLSRQETRSLLWRLSDPLFLIPGNGRYTEHLARVFASREIYEDSELTNGLSWGQALEELLLRYGFVAGWERVRPGMGELSGGSVVEHHHPESRGHLPPLEALVDPSALELDEWVPEDERPRAASAPVLAPLLVEARGQTAVLRRGPDLLVVAAYEPPTDTLLARKRPEDPNGSAGEGEGGLGPRPSWEAPAPPAGDDTLAGLFLLPAGGGGKVRGTRQEGGEGLLLLQAPPGRYLLSLEQWSPSGRWGARLRHGVREEERPVDVPALSDLLLLETAAPQPGSLDEALPRVLSHTEVGRRESLTVAWEVYGLMARREPLTFRLRLQREDRGFFRRVVEGIGLFRSDPPLEVSWTEAGSETVDPLFRVVDLELSDLDSGTYWVRLEMELPRRSRVVARRRITVR